MKTRDNPANVAELNLPRHEFSSKPSFACLYRRGRRVAHRASLTDGVKVRNGRMSFSIVIARARAAAAHHYYLAPRYQQSGKTKHSTKYTLRRSWIRER